MSYRIMLDAGHGGKDPGAVYQGRQEKEDTLKLVLAIGKGLEQYDIQVLYTRTTDVYETPFQKAMEANTAGADLFLSIHRNSFPEENKVWGVESLVYSLEGLKLQIAESINQQLEVLGFVNRGVRERKNLIVLKWTRMPAVLVEVGFINANTDNQLFEEQFDNIATGIVIGVVDILKEEGLLGDEKNENAKIDKGKYIVQIGAFKNKAYAQRLKEELEQESFSGEIREEEGYYKVIAGEYDTLEEAIQQERRLKEDGYQVLVLRN